MGFSLRSLYNRIVSLSVPTDGSPAKVYLLAIINFIGFGFGTIFSGVIDNNLVDIVIGVLQLAIPVVGWIWSILWGILMITRKNRETKNKMLNSGVDMMQP